MSQVYNECESVLEWKINKILIELFRVIVLTHLTHRTQRKTPDYWKFNEAFSVMWNLDPALFGAEKSTGKKMHKSAVLF